MNTPAGGRSEGGESGGVEGEEVNQKRATGKTCVSVYALVVV